MRQQMTAGLDLKLQEMAARIRELREIVGLSQEEMARLTDVDLAEYQRCEDGESDLNFAFIYRCAQAFGVDVTDIVEGSSPRLSNYTLTRAGEGQHVEHAHGMTYYSLAARLQGQPSWRSPCTSAVPSTTPTRSAQRKPIALHHPRGPGVRHRPLSGHLKVQVGEHSEVLGPGDSIYYDSGTRPTAWSPYRRPRTASSTPWSWAPPPTLRRHAAAIGLAREQKRETPRLPAEAATSSSTRIWEKFIEEDERAPRLSEKHPVRGPGASSTFAFDVVDGLARAQAGQAGHAPPGPATRRSGASPSPT